MFGYIVPDKPHLYLKDDTLYKALYCGVCSSLKIKTGLISRFTLSYDMAFLSAFAHNVMGVDVEIEKKHCIAHPFKKRPIAKPDEISKKIADVNVLLAYYKLKDDMLDDKKGNFKSAIFKRAYKKAKTRNTDIDTIVKVAYENLVSLEKQKCSSIDMVSDCFSVMLAEISNCIFGEKANEYTYNLIYSIGKWIYLIDALDDYDKDVKSNNYNVFFEFYKVSTFIELIENNESDIAFIFNDIFSSINENYKQIKKYYNTDLVENILFRGVPNKTMAIFNKGKIKNEN